jgi:hypothetical protein
MTGCKPFTYAKSCVCICVPVFLCLVGFPRLLLTKCARHDRLRVLTRSVLVLSLHVLDRFQYQVCTQVIHQLTQRIHKKTHALFWTREQLSQAHEVACCDECNTDMPSGMRQCINV